MRWDRSNESPNIEDRRSEGGLGTRGAGGFPLWGLLAVGSRFGWRGILVALVVIGAASDAVTASETIGGHVLPQLSRPGLWIAVAALVACTLIPQR
ncbi:MAG TPA: neutral zinc metallopeptidase, partial [Kofleriaceae bacterium]|nr:neutral zinc metallopeptidase [Kofleriaceae bacterium]